MDGVCEGSKNVTKDELKQKLRNAYGLQKQLEAEFVTLQNLKDVANKVTPAYGLTPGGGGTGQRIENATAKSVDLENSIRQDFENLVAALTEIRKLIACVDDALLKSVLHMRYLNYQKWEQIAANLGYSWKQIHRIHNRALNAILKKMT